MEDLSYHDVVVYVNGQSHRIADNYAYQLTCTKTGGWYLWHNWNGKETLIGGEFNDDDFRIEVAGIVICGKKPDDEREEIPAAVGGWTGEIEVK